MDPNQTTNPSPPPPQPGYGPPAPQPNYAPLPPQPGYGPPAPQPGYAPPPLQPYFTPPPATQQAVPQQVVATPGMQSSSPQPYAQPAYPTPPMQPGPAYGYGQQPAGTAIPAKSNGKKILIIIVGVVLVGIFGTAAFILLGKDGNNPLSSITNTISGNEDVVSRSDGTLDLSTLIDSQKTIKAQDIKAGLSQQVNLSDGTSYMVTGVERNFVSSSRYLKAKDGKELIKVSLVVGNRNIEGNSYLTSSFFKISNSAGGLQLSEYASEVDMPDALVGQDIAPGKQVSGAIVFEVDKDEKINGLATENTYKNYTTEEEVSIKSLVSLD